MRILYDVSPLSHVPRTGIPNYVRGALAGLAALAGGKHEIVPFAPVSLRGKPNVAEALDGMQLRARVGRLPPAPLWRTVWSRLQWPPAERFLGRFDVLHFSDWMYPPQRAGVRATVVHDLIPLRFPDWVTPATRWMHNAKYRNAARTCDVVFANSSFTAGEVVEHLGVPAERVRLAPPGVDAEFTPEGPRAELGTPYVLTLATPDPRKNLGVVLEAFEQIDSDLRLAVASPGAPPVLHDRVVWLGYVEGAELARHYRGAEAFVYPSRFEGFGMPVVEAMAAGTPVVASSHRSLDDASGDVAIRADPDSPGSVAAAIEQAIARRNELVPRGMAHARSFTWERTAAALLEGYEAAA